MFVTYTLTVKYDDIQKAQNSFSQFQPNSLTCHFHDCQPHTETGRHLLEMALGEMHRRKRQLWGLPYPGQLGGTATGAGVRPWAS